MKGKVKWFSSNRGYGFIENENKEEVFVHFTDIISDKAFRVLNSNEEVEFKEEVGDKGKYAKDVVVMTSV